MSRLATSFVLGYHGCDRAVGVEALSGKIELIHSDRDFDWLGPGAYFWEADPKRALEWAQWKTARGDYSEPFVIGAVIDLRNCLDLMSQDDLALVRSSYKSFLGLQRKAGLPIPKNRSVPSQPNADRVLRYLDCAVIRHLHGILEAQSAESPIEPFDTVRGMFTEGGRLYTGAGFKQRTHVQIAVRNNDCVRGIFLPRPYPQA